MIEAPKITEEQQKQLRYKLITLIEQYPHPEELEEFRKEWDGGVNFKIIDDHSVIANITGEEKLPDDLKEKTRALIRQFNEGHY